MPYLSDGTIDKYIWIKSEELPWRVCAKTGQFIVS